MGKEWGFVCDLSIMCTTDFLGVTFFTDEANFNLPGMLTHNTTGTGLLEILIP
jgi:hypothetical protein